MGIPCKEELRYFEDLAKEQGRLFPDAADFGVWRTKEELDEDRKQLRELMSFYGGKVSKWGTQDHRGPWGSHTLVCMPIEEDEGKISCLIMEVKYCYSSGRKVKNMLMRDSLEINFDRKLLTEQEAKEKYRCKPL